MKGSQRWLKNSRSRSVDSSPGLLPVYDGLLVPEPDQGSPQPLSSELSSFPEPRLGNSVLGKSP